MSTSIESPEESDPINDAWILEWLCPSASLIYPERPPTPTIEPFFRMNIFGFALLCPLLWKSMSERISYTPSDWIETDVPSNTYEPVFVVSFDQSIVLPSFILLSFTPTATNVDITPERSLGVFPERVSASPEISTDSDVSEFIALIALASV